MTEQRTITVTAYRTPEGKPTCATNIYTGQSCRFLESASFGRFLLCAAVRGDVYRDGAHGYTIPADGCPVWIGVQS